MDPTIIAQLLQRLQAQPEEQPPPPYTHSEDFDDDSDDDEDTDPTAQSHPAPVKLTINATHSIHGSNNLIPTSPTALIDTARVSAVMLAAMSKFQDPAERRARKTTRPVQLDLTINCGITVIGDRNVVGSVGVRPKMPAKAMAGPGVVLGASESVGAVAGVKRKVEDDDDVEGLEAKRVAV